MKIKINGKDHFDVDNNFTILNILENNNVKQPEMVAVQLNGKFVNKTDYSKISIKENDEIDFVYFMGGGEA